MLQRGQCAARTCQESLFSPPNTFTTERRTEGGTESERYPEPTTSQLENLRRVINDGLDFGIVAVWVCPNSCKGSSMEEAIVSIPADF